MPLVYPAYIGLLILVAATPISVFFDNLVCDSTIQFYAAVSMMIIAIRARPDQAHHFFKLVRVPAALAAIPLLWMLIQLLPIGSVVSLDRFGRVRRVRLKRRYRQVSPLIRG